MPIRFDIADYRAGQRAELLAFIHRVKNQVQPVTEMEHNCKTIVDTSRDPWSRRIPCLEFYPKFCESYETCPYYFSVHWVHLTKMMKEDSIYVALRWADGQSGRPFLRIDCIRNRVFIEPVAPINAGVAYPDFVSHIRSRDTVSCMEIETKSTRSPIRLMALAAIILETQHRNRDVLVRLDIPINPVVYNTLFMFPILALIEEGGPFVRNWLSDISITVSKPHNQESFTQGDAWVFLWKSHRKRLLSYGQERPLEEWVIKVSTADVQRELRNRPRRKRELLHKQELSGDATDEEGLTGWDSLAHLSLQGKILGEPYMSRTPEIELIEREAKERYLEKLKNWFYRKYRKDRAENYFQIAKYIIEGSKTRKDIPEIAEALSLSERTVRRFFDDLRVRYDVELVSQ